MNAAITLTSGMRQNLFSIQRTSKLLSANATRLNTGKKINSALDNPVAFFTAIEHTNRARDLMMRKAEMGEGIQTISAASTGIDSMLEMINSAEALAKSALSAGSAEQVEALSNQYNETLNQITAVACDASYKGVGLLRCPPESMTIKFDESGDSSLTVEGECSSAGGLGLSEVSAEGTTETENIEVEIKGGSNSLFTRLSDDRFVVTSEVDGKVTNQIYDVDRNEVGGEIEIQTEGKFSWASSSVFQDGSFIITWSDWDDTGMSPNTKVYAQKFDIDGNAAGNKFRLDSDPTHYTQNTSYVAVSSDGSYAIVWNGHYADDGVGNVFMKAQLFDASGNTIGNVFQPYKPIEDDTNQTIENFIALDNGTFLVTWYENSSVDENDGSYFLIMDEDGNALGDRVKIADERISHEVKQLSDGSIVFAYEMDGVYLKKYDSSGNEVSTENQANTSSDGFQNSVEIASLSDGNFIISWRSNHTGSYEIYSRNYDSDCNPLNSETMVNITSGNTNYNNSVVEMSDGDILHYWSTSIGQGYCTKPLDTVSNPTWDSPSNIQSSLDELQAAKERLRTLQAKFSNNLSIITTRSSFTDSMVNVLETGASNLTNADLNEEGANALMLQTQQSLGMTSLSIASQAAQSVLRLFS